MPRAVTEYRLFFAFPSDIEEEYEVVSALVNEWNTQHGDSLAARLTMTSWRTHAYPSTGDRPQEIINRQVLDDADVLVGVFWSRFGTPTGSAGSGTEEEIRRSIASNRQVMLYFSDRPLPPSKLNATEMERIRAFRTDFQSRGLYWMFTSVEEFTNLFRTHLSQLMHRLLHAEQEAPTEQDMPTEPEEVRAKGVAISVELSSLHWVTVLAALEQHIAEIPKMAKRIAAQGKTVEDFDDNERIALLGPLIARSKIVDAMATKGIMTQEARERVGLEAIVARASAAAGEI